MKVLTVVGNLGIGGTQRVAQNLSLGLAANGVEVAVLAFLGGGPREEICRAGGLQVFAPALADGETDPGFDDAAHEPCEAAIEAARRWNPDIIHIHRTGYADPVETRLLRRLRDNGARTVETNVFARYDRSEGGSLIDAHCLLTKWCAFKWHAWGGQAAARKKAYILPNAVDTKAISAVGEPRRQQERIMLGIRPEQFMFGRVGQPMDSKWMPAILDVFQQTLQHHDIGLLLVGAPPKIVEMVANLPSLVKTRIKIVPPTMSDERLSSLIGAMDGFLHMSAIGESFGMVLCEAMLSGVPVITLSTPLRDNSQLEIVGHEKGGLVALTLGAVPAAMSRLITDQRLRDAVKAGGHTWVADRFGVDVASRKAMMIYQSVLSGMTPPLDAAADPDAPPDRAWLRDMLANGMGGRPDARTRMIFSLLHRPSVYRAYLATKFWK